MKTEKSSFVQTTYNNFKHSNIVIIILYVFLIDRLNTYYKKLLKFPSCQSNYIPIMPPKLSLILYPLKFTTGYYTHLYRNIIPRLISDD